MSCYITYNNKNYTEKDFKEYLKNILDQSKAASLVKEIQPKQENIATPIVNKETTVLTPEMIRARVKSSFDANGYMDIKETSRGDKVILGAITKYIMATKGIITNNQILEANKTFKLKEEVTIETVKEGVLRIKIKENLLEGDGDVGLFGGLDMSKLTSSGESMANNVLSNIEQGLNATVGTLPTVGDKIPFIMPNGDSVSLKVLDETNDMYTVEFPDGTKEEISPMELGLDSWETSKGLKRASTIKKSIWKDVSKNFQSIKYNTDNLKNSKFSNIYNKIKNNQEVVSKDFSSVEEFKEFVDLLKFTYQGKELPILYHGSASLFSNFKEEFLGKYTGAPSAKQAFFAAKDLDTAASYGVTEKHYHDSYEEALERYEDQYIEKEFDFQSSEKNYAENKAFKNEAYADYEENTVKVNTNIYPLFFISDNTLISDVKGNRKNIGSISKVLKDAKEENYDSVIFKDIYDGGFGGNTDVYTVFSSKQIINIFDLINSQLQTKQDIEGFKDFVSKNKSLNNIEQAFKCK